MVVTDSSADRMRAMGPLRSADGVTGEEMRRLMQANFDSALDVRDALARSRLWLAFIHPLSPLEKDEFISPRPGGETREDLRLTHAGRDDFWGAATAGRSTAN